MRPDLEELRRYPCKHCGAELQSNHPNFESNVFTGDQHSVSSCRETLFSELQIAGARLAAALVYVDAGRKLRERCGAAGNMAMIDAAQREYDAAVGVE